MRQEERTQKSREKILRAALRIFGEDGYDAFKINRLCDEFGISKGLLYHNFGNKDELYICCVRATYAALLDYLTESGGPNNPPRLSDYISRRITFFRENPLQARVFFDSITLKNQELRNEILEIRRDLVELNRAVYIRSLDDLELREGVSREEAVAYFSLMQNLYSGYFSSLAFQGESTEAMIREHERDLERAVHLMIYGIGVQKKERQ